MRLFKRPLSPYFSTANMRKIDQLYKSQGIQGVLTIGYLYLVVLGIIGEALYFSQLGVNILKFAAITDVLLSPISKITSHYVLLLVILGLFILFLYVREYYKKDERKTNLRTAALKLKFIKPESKSLTDSFLEFIVIGLLCFYVGIDFGSGFFSSERMEKGTLRYTDKIYFNNNDSTTHTAIVGSNSTYIFYVDSLKNHVSVSPLASVKSFDKKPRKLDFSKLVKKKKE